MKNTNIKEINWKTRHKPKREAAKRSTPVKEKSTVGMEVRKHKQEWEYYEPAAIFRNDPFGIYIAMLVSANVDL